MALTVRILGGYETEFAAAFDETCLLMNGKSVNYEDVPSVVKQRQIMICCVAWSLES